MDSECTCIEFLEHMEHMEAAGVGGIANMPCMRISNFSYCRGIDKGHSKWQKIHEVK